MPVKLELLEYGWNAYVQRGLGPGPRRNRRLEPKDAYVAGARASFAIMCLAVMGEGSVEDVMHVIEQLDDELGLEDTEEGRRMAEAAS